MTGYELVCSADKCIHNDGGNGCKIWKPGQPITVVGRGCCDCYEEEDKW